MNNVSDLFTDQIDYLAELNDQQKAAVLHKDGPAIVLAGAGSGKTRVLTTRVAHLLENENITPEEILLVTFTNKAAGEMNKRVMELTGKKLHMSGTFHSLCAKIMRRYSQRLGIENSFSIYDAGDQLALIRSIYKDRNYDKKKYKPQFAKAQISNAKNEMLSPEEYSQLANDNAQEFVSKVYKEYQSKLQEQNALDFDDLLLKVVNLFQQHKDVLEKYQTLIKHVLVDEYQDTNKAQYHLTKFFAEPHNNLYVVGDFSQSIYAWRGADYRNLMRLGQDYEKLSEYRLEQNYRSTQTILDAATNVIAQNTSHPVLELWTNKSDDEKIKIIETSDEQLEAEKVAQLIKSEVQFNYDEIAVLYRTNAQSRPLEEVFVRQRIPYRIVGGTKFYERKEIKDILAYLRIAVNPTDTVSFNRAEKLGKRRLKKYTDWLEGKSFVWEKQPPLEILENILKKTEYMGKLKKADPQDMARIENIQELINTSANFADTTLFLENVALVQDDYLNADNYKVNPDMITLMSLHSAKGLEYPMVFMVGMEEGLLPHQRSLWEKEQMEEERRLCYVGITRAKNKLIMTYARRRYNFGKSAPTVRSRFLNEIPKKLTVDNGGVKQKNGYASESDSSSWKNNNWAKKTKSPKGKSQAKPILVAPKERKIISDDSLDALLDGELDVKAFLEL